MSFTLLIEVVIILGLVVVIAYMPLQSRFGNVAAKKMVGRESIGLLLIGLLFFVFPQILPPEWQSTNSWLPLLTFALGMWIAYLVALFVRSKSGELIAQIPHYNKTPSLILGLLVVFYVVAVVANISSSKDVLRNLAEITFWTSAVTLLVFIERQSALITGTGFYHFRTTLQWRQIKTYEWLDKVGDFEILLLEVKRWPRLFRFTALQIPSQYKEATEKILSSRVAAQHGVQPTLPSCAS